MTKPPNDRLLELIARVPPLDEQALDASRQRQDRLTKPPGSLGRLERLATQLAGITGVARPRLPRKAVIVMAADHGVTREGVSAYPAQVTAQMVMNFASGGAAINVLARQAGARVIVVDIGVAADLPADLPIVHRKVAFGTQNLAAQAAMTEPQALEAIGVGAEILMSEADFGLDVVRLGEMGIGNTTAASAIVAALVAVELCPRVRCFLIAAHRSVEVGHRAALERLELEPLVALDLRLGEGSGAALVLPMLDAAVALLDEMATFDEAGIAPKISAPACAPSPLDAI